jgi:hypothetical protein
MIDAQSVLPAHSVVCISLPPAVAAAAAKDHRGLLLCDPTKRGLAQILPIGLPSLPYSSDRGTFCVKSDVLVLAQATVGRRCWLPLLVSWDPRRSRTCPQWRQLTVSEKSRVVPAHRAAATRVTWGRNESYVIYRSLGPAAVRTFLGYQTTARFLVAILTPDGSVTPILEIE